MEGHEESGVEKFEKFIWKFENFSRLNMGVYHEHFVLGGYPWRLNLHPKGTNKAGHLSIVLQAVKTANMSKGWSRDVKFKLVVFNQVDTNKSIIKDPDTEFMFAALGRVLYFLKTREVNDMNMKTCKEFQLLWDRLAKFKFDLTWLEPYVQPALGMRSVLEKAMEVEKLKDSVVVLKLETRRLEAKLVAAEENLDNERDLLNANGVKEVDFCSEFGCVS
ncbi:hypothetical protein KIW84_031121 [Lathyrus oleraceus]|uniref:MATH domain-containing protein n=1 Tax=Pisum sativum TaxID=3888 RepID=A0A9D4XUH1_PEA|nr:hypothetical protein KIW84_031121 [Pisum sativum]